MNTDPVSDSSLKPTETSRNSVKSFWIACVGLAIVAHIPALGIATLISNFSYLLLDWMFTSQQSSQIYWRCIEAIMNLAGTTLTPSLVIACIVPILYWRGKLAQRFFISVVIAITVLNIVGSVNYFSPKRLTANWNELGLIIACWLALPILFTWTPLKTRHLRLIVASGVLLLTLCVSMLHMYQAQPNEFFLGWLSLYAAAFSFALLRRNWGRVAMCEADTRADDIETTSTLTLFELMGVSGLACSAISFWSTRFDMHAAILFASAAVFGLTMAFISITLIRFPLETGTYRILKIMLIWLLVTILYHANVTLITLLELSLYSGSTQPILAMLNIILMGSSIASGVYIILTLAIGYWLSWCGWRIDRVPTIVIKDLRSFSEFD